jgi:hypothetical protein
MSPPPNLAPAASQSSASGEGEGESNAEEEEGRRRLPPLAASTPPCGRCSTRGDGKLRAGERTRKGGRGRRSRVTACPSQAPCINGEESEERDDTRGPHVSEIEKKRQWRDDKKKNISTIYTYEWARWRCIST